MLDIQPVGWTATPPPLNISCPHLYQLQPRQRLAFCPDLLNFQLELSIGYRYVHSLSTSEKLIHTFCVYEKLRTLWIELFSNKFHNSQDKLYYFQISLFLLLVPWELNIINISTWSCPNVVIVCYDEKVRHSKTKNSSQESHVMHCVQCVLAQPWRVFEPEWEISCDMEDLKEGMTSLRKVECRWTFSDAAIDLMERGA